VNWLDYTLLFLTGWSAITGAWRGMTRIVFGLASVLVGLLAGIWFYGIPGAWFAAYTSSRTLANFLGFCFVFGVVVLLGAGVSWGVRRIFKLTGLTWLDRALGLVFGLLRGMLLATAFLLILMAFPFRPVTHAVAGSTFSPYFIEVSHVLSALAPKELKDGFRTTYDAVIELWDKAAKKTKLPQATS
jgi:membrane protein required for colicin V production